jgi:hypothetical protein
MTRSANEEDTPRDSRVTGAPPAPAEGLVGKGDPQRDGVPKVGRGVETPGTSPLGRDAQTTTTAESGAPDATTMQPTPLVHCMERTTTYLVGRWC